MVVKREYHHVGIPTTQMRTNERYLEAYGLYVSGFEASEFGIEWMRFEPDSPLPELVKKLPHVAFEVDDLEAALVGHDVIAEPSEPMAGIRVAMVVHDGAPIELMEIDARSPYSSKKGERNELD